MDSVLAQLRWKTYEQAQQWFSRHSLRLSELPIESWISNPMPTRRWGRASWAWFRAPSVLRPGNSQVGAPDRWWSMDAKTGQLQVYAKEDAIAALRQEGGSPAPQGLFALTPRAHTLAEQQGALARLAAAIDKVSEPFFENRWAPVGNRAEAAQALEAATPREMAPFYHALAPDFFAWLKAE